MSGFKGERTVGDTARLSAPHPSSGQEYVLTRDVTIGHNGPVTSDQLKRSRQILRMTQEELALHLGVRRETVARWEIGTRRIPELAARLLKRIEKNGMTTKKQKRSGK